MEAAARAAPTPVVMPRMPCGLRERGAVAGGKGELLGEVFAFAKVVEFAGDGAGVGLEGGDDDGLDGDGEHGCGFG